jgi:DNA-binding NtrC family response regulator
MLLEGRAIGVVEDDPVMGESLVQSLSLEGCHVSWWRTGSDAIQALRSTSVDLVICDIRLPDIQGHDVFRRLASTTSLPPFLFVTAYGDVDQAVSLMRDGAADYVTKPFEIRSVIERVCSLLPQQSDTKPGGALGISVEMRKVETTIRRIADLTTPVLIHGETGCGKEVCARFLHDVSIRSKEPFFAVNCAAIPADALERELFGYRGATSQAFHRGFAERARGGVLFLDEVAELPVALQAKLLRLVETREYHRLGGEKPMLFHGRIICSTNRDLAELVKNGVFREDFYYRIAGMSVHVPALRQRPDDIPWLIERYLGMFRSQDRHLVKGVSSLTIKAALAYGWPGNVRELRNRLERAVALARSEWIMPGDMFDDLSVSAHPLEQAYIEKAFATLSETRDLAERRQIELALEETSGQILEAARLLGVSRTTLWEKMRRFGIPGHAN